MITYYRVLYWGFLVVDHISKKYYWKNSISIYDCGKSIAVTKSESEKIVKNLCNSGFDSMGWVFE